MNKPFFKSLLAIVGLAIFSTSCTSFDEDQFDENVVNFNVGIRSSDGSSISWIGGGEIEAPSANSFTILSRLGEGAGSAPQGTYTEIGMTVDTSLFVFPERRFSIGGTHSTSSAYYVQQGQGTVSAISGSVEIKSFDSLGLTLRLADFNYFFIVPGSTNDTLSIGGRITEVPVDLNSLGTGGSEGGE